MQHTSSLKKTGQVRWLHVFCMKATGLIFIMWCWRESWRVESMTLRGLIESSTLYTTTTTNVNSKVIIIPPCKARPHQKVPNLDRVEESSTPYWTLPWWLNHSRIAKSRLPHDEEIRERERERSGGLKSGQETKMERLTIWYRIATNRRLKPIHQQAY